MIPVAAPPRVRDRLLAAPDGDLHVLHRGPDAIYVDVHGWAVGVVAPGAVQVPCALRLGRPLTGADTAKGAYLSSGSMHLDGLRLSIGRSVAVRAPRDAVRWCSRTTASSAAVLATPPATVAELVRSWIPDRRIDASVARDLLGRGPGLTPLGDDVLAGWLAVHRISGVPTPDVDPVVATAAARTTILSATLLDCAGQGEVVPPFGAWLSALATDRAERALRDLLRVGATSGAGLAYGAAVALTTLQRSHP